MRKIYIILIIIAIIPALMASNNGVAEDQDRDRTGAPGSSNGCNNSGCHTSGAFSPTTQIRILEPLSMTPVNSYFPGQTYIMEVQVIPGTGNPSTYGFQATAVMGKMAINAGTFQNPGTDVQLEDVDGRHIVEHSVDSPDNRFDVEWIAPEAGNGQVDFYAAGVASNNSNTDSGDGYDAAVFSLEEATSAVKPLEKDRPYVVNAHLARITTEQNAVLEVYNINGQLTESIRLSAGEMHHLNTKGWNVLRIRINDQVFGEKLFIP